MQQLSCDDAAGLRYTTQTHNWHEQRITPPPPSSHYLFFCAYEKFQLDVRGIREREGIDALSLERRRRRKLIEK